MTFKSWLPQKTTVCLASVLLAGCVVQPDAPETRDVPVRVVLVSSDGCPSRVMVLLPRVEHYGNAATEVYAPVAADGSFILMATARPVGGSASDPHAWRIPGDFWLIDPGHPGRHVRFRLDHVDCAPFFNRDVSWMASVSVFFPAEAASVPDGKRYETLPPDPQLQP